MRLALTRDISPAIARCELTHLDREAIDLPTARRQHDAYEQRLRDAGCAVVRLAAEDEMPDSVFIEDIAMVFDEVALIARPGAVSRRHETDAVAAALAGYRPIVRVEAPATIDGGDVLTMGKRVFVGETSRTNPTAITQMSRHLSPYGYTVHIVPVRGCLHLKSAVTAVSDDTLLINPAWVPADRFRPLTMLDVHPAEANGANALRVGDSVIYPTTFPRTRARLEERGFRVAEVDVSEIAKAEGAVTCCSLIFTTLEVRMSDPQRDLLRHALATVAYRGGKAIKDAPAGFAAFRSGDTSRSPAEILAHVGDLFDWALSLVQGTQVWHDSPPLAWGQEVVRFYDALGKLDDYLASEGTGTASPERLLQGPIADALTHVGQLTLLRRLAGAPIRGENYYAANIVAGRVGSEQAEPRREF